MKRTFWLLVGVCAAPLTGCIHTEETVYRDEPRMKVEFENDTAARLFYETLNAPGAKRDRSESDTRINIPIIFEHKQKIIRGESHAFNEAVRRCDTNGDGRITELEARVFAHHH